MSLLFFSKGKLSERYRQLKFPCFKKNPLTPPIKQKLESDTKGEDCIHTINSPFPIFYHIFSPLVHMDGKAKKYPISSSNCILNKALPSIQLTTVNNCIIRLYSGVN